MVYSTDHGQTGVNDTNRFPAAKIKDMEIGIDGGSAQTRCCGCGGSSGDLKPWGRERKVVCYGQACLWLLIRELEAFQRIIVPLPADMRHPSLRYPLRLY